MWQHRRTGSLSVRDTVEALCKCSDQSSAVERSFLARLGASGPRIGRLHSYKASGSQRCLVATLIVGQGQLSVRDTVEALFECFLTRAQQGAVFSSTDRCLGTVHMPSAQLQG